MKKMTTFIMLMVGLSLLFYVTGLTQDCKKVGNTNDYLCKESTATNTLLDMALHPERITDPSGKMRLALIGSLLTITTVVVGYFTKSPEYVVRAGIAVFLFDMLSGFIKVINVVSGVNETLSLLLFSPFMVLFIVAMVDWVGGAD